MAVSQSHGRARALLAAGISALAIGLVTPASAQDQTPDEAEDRSDEILVTAQFREQNVQDTPLAITAVTGPTALGGAVQLAVVELG